MSQQVEVSFAAASPDWQICLLLAVPASAQVSEVLQRARAELQGRGDGLARRVLAEAPWDEGACGIFGEVCARDHSIEAGDRIELYWPLQADPKIQRRRRAEASQTAKSRNPLTTRSRR